MPSNILKSAKKSYDGRNWDLAAKLAYKVLKLDDKSDDARIILFKALVRINPDNPSKEQDEILKQLEEHNHPNTNYLKGFRELKRHKFLDAITYFYSALNSGDKSIPVYRDLSECLYLVGNIKDAKKQISLVINKYKISNRYILDIAAKIAIEDKDFDNADLYIEKLELYDYKENVEHRKATYALAKGDYLNALEHSNNACNSTSPLPQMLLLRMKINIILNRYSDVEKDYKTLNNMWADKDVLNILYARMLLEREGWESAEKAFENIPNKSTSYACNLKPKILSTKLSNGILPLYVKKQIEEEIRQLAAYSNGDLLNKSQYFEANNIDID